MEKIQKIRYLNYLRKRVSPSPMVIALHRVSPPPARRSPASNIYSADCASSAILYTERKQTSADL